MNKVCARIFASTAIIGILGLLTACAPAVTDTDTLVIYSGRDEALVDPIIRLFEEETGVNVDVRYGDSAELAAQLSEEGAATKADIFFAQDAGALGAIESEGLFLELSSALLDRVQPEYRSANSRWIGVTGRARVFVYNPEMVTELPTSVLELAEPQWADRIAVAPTNASFQTFVTALRVINGDDIASSWLSSIADNAQRFEKNSQILDAVEAGTVAAGLINHYYWFQREVEVGPGNMVSRLAAFAPGDAGNLINVSGVGVLSDNPHANDFVSFLVREDIQRIFVTDVMEYPMVAGIDIPAGLTPLSEIPNPDIDLANLNDLKVTLELIRASGMI
ncbi:MAG: iron ABC transporter substrate-binding protein [Microbacteriaceae bacterium]|nr:iron ABC transporter substrate-binding protein [Microbacteriaceae bacterium]